jgi:rod shape-determining protein MreB
MSLLGGAQGVGIDLGTANTVVCDTDGGVVFREPSVIAWRVDGAGAAKVIGVGTVAEEMMGKAPKGIRVDRLQCKGVMTDVDITGQFLEVVLGGIAGRWRRRHRMSAVIAVPAGANPIERRGVVEAAARAGLRRTQLVPAPVAAAVGCGIDPLRARAHLVVDAGAGSSQVVAFAGKGMLTYRRCPVAGDEMTSALSRYLRRRHRLIVGELTAERAKIAAFSETGPALTVDGFDAGTGRARTATLAREDVFEAVQPVTEEIATDLGRCLPDLPAGVVSDVMQEGIVGVGGAMLVPELRSRLEESVGLAMRTPEQPLTRVAEGAARCLTNPEFVAVHALR